MNTNDSTQRKYRLSLAPMYIFISFLFIYLYTIYAGNECIANLCVAVGILAGIWAILVCLSVPRIKLLNKIERLVVKATEGVGEFYAWLFTVIAYWLGLVFNLAGLAGKGIPAAYFIFFYVVAIGVGFFLALQAWYIRRQ